MNKRLLTFIVLFLTTVTLGIMFWSTSSRVKFIKEITDKQLKEKFAEEFDTDEIINKIEESILNQNSNYDKNINDDLKEDYTDNISEKESQNIIDEENKSQTEKEDNSLENAKNNIEGDYLVEDEYGIDEEESIGVFKVDKHSIPSKIKRSDKLKLLSISKSLSFSDYGILLEHIKRSDELDAAVDIFKILKDRLDEDEYKVIKDVMEPYINIELIESNI